MTSQMDKLTFEEIRIKIKEEDGALEEWAKTIFQKHWNKHFTEELKKLPRIRWHAYNPAWTHEEAKDTYKQALKKIYEDTNFINSITHPYGVKWKLDEKGFLHFIVD